MLSFLMSSSPALFIACGFEIELKATEAKKIIDTGHMSIANDVCIDVVMISSFVTVVSVGRCSISTCERG